MSKELSLRWLKSLLVATVIFISFALYLTLRRGYYNLYIANKVFGSTAAVLAGLTLLIGPLSRFSPLVARFMTLRRQLGLVAFGAALIHIVLSTISLGNRFPLAWYIDEWIPTLFGILAIVFWLYLTYLSRDAKIREMGSPVWKKQLQLFSYLGFLAVFLHLVIMKYQGWIRWWNGQVQQTPELANPSYPPASLFVFGIMVGIIIYRLLKSFKLPASA